MNNPINKILPRESDKEIAEILNHFSLTIDEVVNFGTHMLKWLVDEKRGGDEQLPLVMFLRDILEKADSISILVKNSSADPAKVILRSLFELHLYILYLLDMNFEDRSMAFLVWNSKNIIKRNRSFLKGNKEYNYFKKQIEKDNSYLDGDILNEIPSALPIIENQKRLLKQPEYKKALIEYEKTKKRLKRNPSWYSLFNGPQNIQKLAERLKMSSLYEIVYRQWSGNVHSTDVIGNKIVKGEGAIKDGNKVTADIVQLRLPKDAQNVSAFTMVFLLTTYSSIIDNVIIDKKDEYRKWHISIGNKVSSVTGVEQLIKIKY